MTAPERIWATWKEDFGAVQIGTWADTVRFEPIGVEYVRADLMDLALEEAKMQHAQAFGAGVDHGQADPDPRVEKLMEALRASREVHCGIAEHILKGGVNTNGIFADSQRARLAIDAALAALDAAKDG